MQYIYYKDAKGNFGDDLNAWLWPKLFGAHNEKDDEAFVGIGSILCKDSPLFRNVADKKKIVFGTGIRPSYEKFELDDSWDVRFLRGPMSAAFLGNRHEYIADAAYATGLINDFGTYLNTPKKYKISVIPYFRSLRYFNWEQLCKKLGFHYISPLAEQGIEYTLREIAASEFVITEAMHGAIIADMLRVPWSRFVLTTPYIEGSMVSEFKWTDWLHSVEVFGTNTTHLKFYRKSFLHNIIKNLTGNRVHVEFLSKGGVQDELLTKLSAIKDFHLSEDHVIDRINNRMQEKAVGLRKEITLYDKHVAY